MVNPFPNRHSKREALDVNGLKVVFVDITGRFNSGSVMPGAAAAAPKDDFRMLAAIVETASGPWFFKAYGPAATMARHHDEFVEFLHTMTPK